MSLIDFRNITKFFGEFAACRNISLLIQKSTVHSIVGENGAGKSTLVKILGGIEKATEGEIFLNGQVYLPNSAQDAFKNKIAFIHQHFVLADHLTAIDNLVLNASSNQNPLGFRNTSEILKKANLLLKRFNWTIPLHKNVGQLSVGEQQRLEILKALMQEPEILIFDEPTAVLSPLESDELLKFITQLKNEGKTIILISHKLNEIKNISDQISILRQGKLISTHARGELSVEQIAEIMIGRRIVKNNFVQRSAILENLFRIPNSEISIRKSEVFGVAGIEGNGQSELIANLLTLFKLNKLTYGDITEDRLKFSLFEELNLSDHMLLKHKSHFIHKRLVNKTLLTSATRTLVKLWDVRPQEIHKPLADFSGGNQQKFIVARELWDSPEVLLAAHPTRGVDLGAQEKIHNSLLSYTEKNRTVVLVSSDLDEILYLSDRYIVLNKGLIYGPFNKKQLSEKEIGIYMAGQQ